LDIFDTMARSDTTLWIIAAFAISICTLFLISYKSTSHEPYAGNQVTQLGHPDSNLRSVKSVAPNQFKIPLLSRDGHMVIARFDYHMTNIKEINVTTHYTEFGQEKTMDLFVMATTTNPPFAAVIANPHQEAASWDVYENGDMEIPTRRLFEMILNGRCNDGQQLVVDAGANLGYFATYSGVMGCRVIAFEPQPRLLPIINTSRLVNGLTDRFTLHNNIVNVDRSARLKIVYANGVCTGCSAVSPAQPGEQNTANSFIIDAVRIDEKVKENVLLMKVDVEGYEVLAIESAKELFDKYEVKNILVEWFPARFPHGPERGTKLLEDLVDKGYKVRHYDLRFQLPREWCQEEVFPIAGRTWLVPRDKLKDMNEYLMKANYGEANLWISKER